MSVNLVNTKDELVMTNIAKYSYLMAPFHMMHLMNKMHILNPVKYLGGSPFAKINNDYQPLNISAKKLCGYSICFMYKHKSQRAGQLPQEHVFLANLLSQNIYYTQWRSALWIPVKELILLTKFDSNSSCD